MNTKEIEAVFKAFAPSSSIPEFRNLVSGHINQTWKVDCENQSYIFQKINTALFQNPEILSQNILGVSNHLKESGYPHDFPKLLNFPDGKLLFNKSWRVFKMIENTQTFEKVQSPEQAFEAAKFLSEFHFYLKDFPVDQIHDSIPDFLNFELRKNQFEMAKSNASTKRLQKSLKEIAFLDSQSHLIKEWEKLNSKKRIIHADPKISNFLFAEDSELKVKALIDWDTLMSGNILYDFGDMVRSYTNLREEDDPEKGGNFSYENYKALKEGFLFFLKKDLTEWEIKGMETAAKTVIYVQALRFLTDYLGGDIYYRIHYPDQNWNRAKNQINLLEGIFPTPMLS